MSDLFILRNAIRDLLRPRRALTAVLLALLPGVVGLLHHLQWATHRHAHHASRIFEQHGRHAAQHAARARDIFQPYSADGWYTVFSSVLVFHFVLVIMALVFATAIIAQEMEQKTISYLLTRPVPRWRILLTKHAVVVYATTLVTWISCILLGLVTYGPSEILRSRVPLDIAVVPIGALAYCALFTCLATRFHNALVGGLIFVFGWESWVSSLPGNFQLLSLMAYLRVLAPHGELPPDAPITPRLAWIVLTCVIVIGTLGALFIFSRREYVPKDSAE
jgi:hypothetical protein